VAIGGEIKDITLFNPRIGLSATFHRG